jgi:Tol biopolymer transport system component
MSRTHGAGIRTLLSLLATGSLVMACADATAPAVTADLRVTPAGHLYNALFQDLTPERIYIADEQGANIRSLTGGDSPAWSPDGSRIAFVRDGMILVIDVATRSEQQLIKGNWPTWSPDGEKIAFASVDGISVMTANGSAVRTLIRHGFRDDTWKDWDMGVGKPAWSPNGLRIAFEHLGDGDMQPAQVFIMNADGSLPVRVSAAYTTFRYAESDPAWSPDGQRLTFWSYGFGIAISDLSTGLHQPLYSNFPYVAYGAKPAWSPDGKLILVNTFPWNGTKPDLLVLRVDGRNPGILLRNARSASWSPDGKRIAFVSTQDAKTKQGR